MDQTRVSELRLADSDLVLEVRSRGKLVCAIVFEVQLAIDRRKARTWPLYAAWVHHRLGCPVHVVVLTVDAKVARWAAGPFGAGDLSMRTCVIGPEHIPPITDAGTACANVELTFLSALAHAKEPIALEIGRVLWHALDATDHEQGDLYWDIFMSRVHIAIRRALAMELQGWKPQSTWGKRIYAEGRAKGVAEGRAKGVAEGRAKGVAEGEAHGLAEGVLTLLRVRSIALTRAQREQIRTCRDPRRLRVWLRRAGTARSGSELLEREPATAPRRT
jgi:hypothetical protein